MCACVCVFSLLPFLSNSFYFVFIWMLVSTESNGQQGNTLDVLVTNTLVSVAIEYF